MLCFICVQLLNNYFTPFLAKCNPVSKNLFLVKNSTFFIFPVTFFDFLTFILVEHVKGKRILSGRAGAGVGYMRKTASGGGFS